jgi:acetyl esterase
MPLDPEAEALLAQFAAAGGQPLSAMSVAEARRMMDALAAIRAEPPPIAHALDWRIPGPAGEIPVRIYTPRGAAPFPVLVYFHGGGWVIGSIDTHDGICRELANAASCIVVSVEYRLAPEHKFPAAAEDCHAATLWGTAHATELGGDPRRVAIGGDSAGGNLAAVVAQMARDRGGPPLVFQLLIYPATDAAFDTPSYRDNADGYLLTTADMRWFWNHYLRSDADAAAVYASPLRAASLAGLPPALVLTAEFDPLRDEGERYAARLEEARVPTRLIRYDGMIHGFFGMTSMLQQARTAVGDAAAALTGAFSRR